MRICMLVRNPCTHDQRVMREARALAEAGHEVTILAHHLKDLPVREIREGYTIRRIPLIHLPAAWRHRACMACSSLFYPLRRAAIMLHTTLRRKLSKRLGAAGAVAYWLTLLPLILPFLAPLMLVRLLAGWAHAATGSRWMMDRIERLRPVQWIHSASYLHQFREAAFAEAADVYHAHDLNTLDLAARAARRNGAALIYDSHEFQMGREAANWSRFDWRYWSRQERRLIHLADRVITVSDSIAEALVNRYKIRRPVVVTNANAILTGPPPTAGEIDWRERLGVRGDQRLVMYVGGIQPKRGLEVLIEAMGRLDGRHFLVIIGPMAVEGYGSELGRRIEELNMADRVVLHDAIPPDQVAPALAQADASILLTQNSCPNHYMSLPNKLFSSIAAGSPLVASDLAEIRHIVTGGPFGVVCHESDPQSVADAIQEVTADPQRYRPGAEALAAVESQYGWTTCRRRLLDIYNRLAVKRDRRRCR